jgi:hypothetical protein
VESNWVHSARRPLIGLLWPALGDYEGEFGAIKIGRGNRSTRRKPAPAPLCPRQIPLDQTRDRTRADAMGSQRLTAGAMARPMYQFTWCLGQILNQVSAEYNLETLPLEPSS